MNRAIEKQLSDRALALGKSGDGDALPELTELLATDSVAVRRLAASAIGKLAGFADARLAVETLRKHLADPHPQVRQYAVKGLKAYGAEAKSALADLHDMAANESEKPYNQRDAQLAAEVIAEALRIREKQAIHQCQRCSVEVGADEFARSQRAFQRCFCDRCFDEVYLERRNFDMRIELNKTIRASDGTLVQSRGERRIADWLTRRGIAYRYDERMRIIEGYAVRPDFYLPEFDLYIEYWGMDTTDYKIAMLKKKKLYQQEGKKLVSVEREESDRIETVLQEKLSRHIHLPSDPLPDTKAGEAPSCAPTPAALLQEVGEEAEVSCMFDVLDRYRRCLRLLLFHDTDRPPPSRTADDTERLQRTRGYCLNLRGKLAAGLDMANHNADTDPPPLLSTLLRTLADRKPTVRGKGQESLAPFLLAWKLTHRAAPHPLRMSEAAACLLWYLRVTGNLDPEDRQAPTPDTISALILFMADVPENRLKTAAAATRRMLTALNAAPHNADTPTEKELLS